jgi:hypothetical protein
VYVPEEKVLDFARELAPMLTRMILNGFDSPVLPAAFVMTWLHFYPPLASVQPGGPSICSVLIKSGPMWLDPKDYKGFDPKFNDFSSAHPFKNNLWSYPRGGSLLDQSWVNEIYKFLEYLIKGLSDYIHSRVGEIPSCSYKAFSNKNFD